MFNQNKDFENMSDYENEVNEADESGQTKKKRFKLFNYTLEGKGVPKDVDETRNFTFFFKLLGRKINTLLSVNLLLFFGNFPSIFILFAMSGNLNTTSYAPLNHLSSPVNTILESGKFGSVAHQALESAFALQTKVSVPTTATYIFYGLGALVILTFGLTMVGTTYIVRNLVKGEPVFLMSDFFYAIKRNWKQGLIFGVLDIAICGVIVFDILIYALNAQTYVQSLIFFASIAIGLIYFVMRFYIYVMMVTFKLNIYKLLKNALIFAIVGFKRNILAFLGIIFVIFVNYCLVLIFPPLGLLLPFVITPAIMQFTAIYASYPKIYEIMIEPYEDEDEQELPEPIFKDQG